MVERQEVYYDVTYRSRDHCCNGNTKILSVCTVETACHCHLCTDSQNCFYFWPIYVPDNEQRYVGGHVKWPIFLFNCNKIWLFFSFWKIFIKFPNTKFHENCLLWCSLMYVGTQTDGQLYGRILRGYVIIGAFCNKTKAPKNWKINVKQNKTYPRRDSSGDL